MPKIDQAQLYQTQISLSEWFEKIGHSDIANIRLEDNEKRERLAVLNKILNIPFDKPTQFPAKDIANVSTEFKIFLKQRGDELCALRLIPLEPNLPKLRIRGKTIKDSVTWFNEQNINPELYKADFIPHGENQKWSTIFIVNESGIFGEIIKGGHYQLTQGFYDQGEPIPFTYDFKKLTILYPSKELQKYLKNIFKWIHVTDSKKRKALEKELDAKFANNYLCGYFETVDTEEFGLWYVDYNRLIGNAYQPFQIQELARPEKVTLKGLPGSIGKVSGTIRIVTKENIESVTLSDNEILVCQMTTPDYLPLMQQACAVVTDFGGILSHAAIICRELGKPCITATKQATTILQDGDIVTVDANNGTITYSNNL